MTGKEQRIAVQQRQAGIDKTKMAAQKAQAGRVFSHIVTSYNTRIAALQAQIATAKSDADKQKLQSQIDALKASQAAATTAATQVANRPAEDPLANALAQKVLSMAASQPTALLTNFQAVAAQQPQVFMLAQPAAPPMVMAPAPVVYAPGVPAQPVVMTPAQPATPWGGPATTFVPVVPVAPAEEPRRPKKTRMSEDDDDDDDSSEWDRMASPEFSAGLDGVDGAGEVEIPGAAEEYTAMADNCPSCPDL